MAWGVMKEDEDIAGDKEGICENEGKEYILMIKVWRALMIMPPERLEQNSTWNKWPINTNDKIWKLKKKKAVKKNMSEVIDYVLFIYLYFICLFNLLFLFVCLFILFLFFLKIYLFFFLNYRNQYSTSDSIN